jgi:endogenous inhibitor of DNA gyrase (YacG/DUF329 family)
MTQDRAPQLQGRMTTLVFGIAFAIVVVTAIIGIIDTNRTGPYLGTAGLTLLLAGFVQMSLRMCEKRSTRSAGFLSLGIVVTAWVLFVLAIWADEFMWGSRLTEQFGVSAGILLACWPPLGIGVTAMCRPYWTACGRVLVGGFSIVLAVWLIGLWSGRTADDIAGTFVPVAAATVLAALLQPKTRIPWVCRQVLMLFAVAGAFLWARLWLHEIDVKAQPLQAHLAAVGLCVGALGGGLNLLIDLRLPKASWLRLVTMFMVLATMVCTYLAILEIVFEPNTRGEPAIARVWFASAIITVACVIAIGAVCRFGQSLIESSHNHAIHVTCPRCQRPLSLQQGDQTCDWCSLRFRLAFESPDCITCGYVLAPHFPDQCPECGTLVVGNQDAPERTDVSLT